jgi:tetratricopeptide (TPR) repeat protein
MAFVGRSGELAALETALAETTNGRGRIFFLVGEPGIGKTRLADEFCARAAGSARVLWGRCWEAGGAPAFWPWIEILRPLVAEGDAAALAGDFGQDASLVATLLPEIRSRLPGLPEQPVSESQSARFLLFDAIARFVRARATRRPLVLVLDDLHAADEPSLRLLEFVARGLRGAHVLVLGTYRDADPALGPEKSQLLANIAREAQRVALRRLRGDEVATFIEIASGAAPSADVVEAIVRVTEGTPLFVNEVVALVAAHGLPAVSPGAGRIVVPDGLGPAIRGHVARVSDGARTALRAAAVLGRDFRVSLVDALLRADGTPSSDLGQELDEAARAGLVADLYAEPARFRFSHILVRETIYGDLGAASRERLHAKAAQALLDAGPDANQDGRGFAELAHHFLRAGESARDEAVRHSRLAGDHALRIHAHEQAATHFRQALDALRDGAEARRTRAEVLLALADAYQRGGDRARANEASERAAETAQAIGDGNLLAHAALQRGREFTFGLVDPALVRWLEAALAEGAGQDPALRARLMARLAAARQPAPDPEEPLALAREAVALARTTADRRALAAVLRDARAAYLPMDSLEQRTALDLETLALAYETGDLLAALHAERRLGWDRLEEGQLTAALAHSEQCARIAEDMRESHRQWWSVAGRLTHAMLTGAFSEADGLLAELERATAASPDPSARDFVHIQKLALVWTARRDDELAGIDEVMAQQIARQPTPTLRFFRGVVRHRMGDFAYVKQAWTDLRRAYPHPRFWGQHLFAQMAVVAGDLAFAAELYDRLVPWAERFVANLAFEGSYARTLGIVAHALGRTDDARRHFEAAIAREEGIGARPWVAHSLVAYARALLTTGNDRDRRKASELMVRAGAIARELGMPGILAMLPEGPSPGDAASEAKRTSVAPDLSGAFRLEGEYWTVTFRDERVRLKDNKGLQLVAYLVQHPDREFHVLHLVGVADKQAGSPALLENPAPTPADATARAAYKRRLDDLREELDDAESSGDLGRAERARAEMEILGEEIGRGLGLGGRERATGGSVERARVNVQRRISDALSKIGAASPALGRHLSAAIRTGTYCSYVSS